MQLGLYNREKIQSDDPRLIGDAVADQFQRTHGAITAWQEVEHTDDGHHTDITADSITVSPGGITAGGSIESGDGGFTGEGGQVAIGDLPIGQVPGQPPQSPGMGIKIGPWRIVADAQASPGTPTLPSLAFQFLNEAFGPYLFRFKRLATYDWTLTPMAGVFLRLGTSAPGERLASIDTVTLGASGAATVGSLASNGVITAATDINCAGSINAAYIGASGAYYEQGRGIPQGWWFDVAWNPALFATYGGGTWTVPSASFVYRLTLIGKTLHCRFQMVASSIGSGASIGLLVTLPAGITFGPGAGAPLTTVPYVNVNGAQLQGAYVQVLAANQWGIMYGAGFPVSASAATIYGSFTAEIA